MRVSQWMLETVPDRTNASFSVLRANTFGANTFPASPECQNQRGGVQMARRSPGFAAGLCFAQHPARPRSRSCAQLSRFLAVQGKQHDPHVEKEKHIQQQPLGFRTCCPGSVWGLVMVILHLMTNKRDAVIPVTQANPFLNKISLQSARSPKTCANLVSFGLKYCCWAACLWCWWGGIYF